jgi:hypothetical protein
MDPAPSFAGETASTPLSEGAQAMQDIVEGRNPVGFSSVSYVVGGTGNLPQSGTQNAGTASGVLNSTDDGGKKDGGKGKGSSDDRNPSQDKKLTPDDIKNLQKQGWGHREKGNHGGQTDLWKDKEGNVYQKPKNGTGPGEPIGYNLNNTVSHDGNYVAPGNHPNVSPVAAGVTLGGILILIGEYGWPLLAL